MVTAMARKHQDEIRAQVRKLRSYSDGELDESAVHHLAVLAAKASEDKSVAAKIVKAFNETVAAVPPPDRVKFLYVLVVCLTIVILAGMSLKAFGVW